MNIDVSKMLGMHCCLRLATPHSYLPYSASLPIKASQLYGIEIRADRFAYLCTGRRPACLNLHILLYTIEPNM